MRKQQRLAHWKYKVLASRGRREAQEALTKRNNLRMEYKKRKVHIWNKNSKLRKVEQTIATLEDSWKMIKKIKLASRARKQPANILTEPEK